MDLTVGQQAGLAMAKRLATGPAGRVAVLAGFAGTGKSTLLKMIAEEIGIPVIITPTGKAAARVKEVSGLGALTCHRWMYESATNEETGKVEFSRRLPHQLAKGECSVLVIDEASMVNRELWDDISDNAKILGLRILCIGDSFQLPPVDDKETGFSLLDPDAGLAHEYVLMTEVLRQAQESTVIRASMKLRDGDVIGALAELPKVAASDFLEAGARVQARGGVVICHQNKTRHWANNGIRAARNLPKDSLEPGEPLLVLRNNYNLGVFNGETHVFNTWVEPPMGRHSIYDRWTHTREESRLGVASITTPDQVNFTAVLVIEELFGRLTVGMRAIENTADVVHGVWPMVHANLGYTMTAHKSQGSEWDEVLVAWEPTLRFWGQFRNDALRWSYTSVTRAKEKCSISLGATAR